MNFDIAIIGGGASGLAAAVEIVARGASVAILERQPRVGKKLSATGNGRCNIYNLNARPEAYIGRARFTIPAFMQFSKERAEEFFEKVGLSVYYDSEGRAYPMSDSASSVVDCLRFYIAERGAQTLCGFDTKEIRRSKDGFTMLAEGFESVSAKRVIVAAGGLAAPKSGGCDGFKKLLSPLGHSFTRCLPALTQIKTNPEEVRGLKGVRHKGEIALMSGREEVAREKGEILFSEDGVSGIAAMQLSLKAQTTENAKLLIPLFSISLPEMIEYVKTRALALPDRRMDEFLTGVLGKRLALLAVKRAELPLTLAASELDNSRVARLSRELTMWTLSVRGVGGFEQAQVMAGGADTSMFDPNTLMSLKVRGLYACGELLDIVGPCGGYNLAWAWASGLLAGRSAAESL